MSVYDLRKVSFFDVNRNYRMGKTYKSYEAVTSRMRSLAKEEVECVFIPADYSSHEDNLQKRQECFMCLTDMGIYPIRLDMPDNDGAVSTEFFKFEDIGDYDIVIFEALDFDNISYTETYIYNSLHNKEVVYLY